MAAISPAWTPETLDVLPRLGWAAEPTPVTDLPSLAAEIGLDWLGVKRDDLAQGLAGGTKTRKLDFLLAQPPLRDAEGWASAGAIGSGHLAALSLAARKLDRRLLAHCFWEPLSAGVLSNLACTAGGRTSIRYSTSRATLALRHPAVLLARRCSGCAVVEPGASSPLGMLGIVRGGLELAGQVQEGALPRPDRVYVPWGTGGTAVGLTVGLALGGVPVPVVAVAVVERVFATLRRAGRLLRALLREIERGVAPVPAGFRPAPLVLVSGQVGRGYGHTTPASCAACERLSAPGLLLEPVYGGKAFSALLDHAGGREAGRVLYWLTSHGGHLPEEDGWRDRLPAALLRDLRRAEAGKGPSRRGLLAAGAAAAGLLVLSRATGYGVSLPSFFGDVLSLREAEVVLSAAEAIVPEEPGPLPAAGPTATELVSNVDRYLRCMPAQILAEVHAMLLLLEHGTVLGGRLRRLTRQDPAARRALLLRLSSLGGPLAQAVRGIRDLCYVGWYQDPRTWAALGYGGPWVRRAARDARPPASSYDALLAAPGALPAGASALGGAVP